MKKLFITIILATVCQFTFAQHGRACGHHGHHGYYGGRQNYGYYNPIRPYYYNNGPYYRPGLNIVIAPRPYVPINPYYYNQGAWMGGYR